MENWMSQNGNEGVSLLRKLPIGISDFKEIIEDNFYYVDKSLFIKDVLDLVSKATLIPRPRRFGKTLNISMLKYYFEKSDKDYSYLFKDLAIWQSGEAYRRHQGQYPVIFLTFKDVHSSNWELCYGHLQKVIAKEYERHMYLLESNMINDINKKEFTAILNNTANRTDYENALKNLSHYLGKFYDKKVMIFIDEYDTPVQQGFLGGYYNEIIEFMRNFLSGALKDNPALEKGILTGILRVAKESIFTGLNNFEVYSILKNEFSTYFGFLENEVHAMLQYYGIETALQDVRSWYNGYIFGQSIVYNPWSMLKFAKEHPYGLIPHWLNTSSNELVKRLIIAGGQRFKSDIEKLIKGESVEKVIDDNIVFADLDTDPESVWSFLLFTGYLKVINKKVKDDQWWSELQIPNREVGHFYKKTIIEWFKGSATSEKLQEMLEGLIAGDLVTFEYYFKQFVLHTMSYFDPTGEEPERVYQAFVLGLLVSLSDHFYVKSNRESGLGRYDIALIPRDIKTHPKGMIFEFKKANPATKETIEEALIVAERQIERKNYEAELIDAGVMTENIMKIAVAFEGKELLLKWK
jgi:hypothetical protein